MPYVSKFNHKYLLLWYSTSSSCNILLLILKQLYNINFVNRVKMSKILPSLPKNQNKERKTNFEYTGTNVSEQFSDKKFIMSGPSIKLNGFGVQLIK